MTSKSSPQASTRSIAIAAWVLLAFGAVVLSLGLYGAQKGWETLGWRQVPAEILDKRLAQNDDIRIKRTPGGHKIRRVKRDALATFHVVFAYDLDGEAFLAGGVERGALGMQTVGKARELDRLYPVGLKTTVAVNPADPEEAYLVAGISAPAKMMSVIGLVLLLAGFLVRKLARGTPAGSVGSPVGGPQT